MEIKELFEILPQGIFTSPDELQAFINEQGVDDLYPFINKQAFPTLEDFQVSLKKNDNQEINTDLQSQDGSSGQLNLPEYSVEEEGFFERNLGRGGITDLLDDTTNSIRQGFAQGSSLKEALRLQRKGSRATKEDIDRYEAAVRKMQSIPVTDEQRSFNKIYEENDKSWLGFAKGIYKNPSVLSSVILQSAASMLNPTVAFGTIKGGVIGAITAGAAGAAGGAAFGGPGGAAGGGVAGLQQGGKYGAIIGLTNTLEGGLAFTEFLQEEIEKKGLEFDDDGIAAILNDDEAYRRVKSRTKKRGYSIGLVNAITYGIASTLARSGRNIKRLGNLKIGSLKVPLLPGPQTAIRSTTEMIGGGLGEVAGRAAAGQEMDVAEIGFEALGELGSPEAIIPLFKNSTYTIDGENVTRNDVIDAIKGPREDLLGMDITIKNDTPLDNDVKVIMERALIEKRVKEGLTSAQNENITAEQMNQLIDLNIEYETLVASNTPEGKRNAQKIDEQIQTITNAIQEPSTEEIPLSKQPETSPTVGTGDTEGTATPGEIAPESIKDSEEQAQESENEIEISEDEIESLAQDIERIEDEGTFNDNIGEKAYKDDQEGMIKIDDQNENTLVFETNSQIVELGNVDEIGNDIVASKGLTLTPPEGVDVTKVDDAADVVDIDGIKYKIIGRRRDKKGKAVVRVKEIETGLDRRFVGPKAERILKDQALKKPSTPPPVSVTLERVQTTQPEINQVVYEQKSLNEIIELEKKAEQEVKAFEKKVLEEMVSETINKDLVQVKENIFQVTQQPNGEFKVSQMREDGKLVGRFDTQTRSAAISKFKQEKNRQEKALIKKADKKVNEFKKNQEDKIISALDSLIKATSTKGRAFDATLGIPLSIANSSLKVIKAAYKAGKSLAAAIADGLKFLQKQGYTPNAVEYKRFVLESFTKPTPPKNRITKAKEKPEEESTVLKSKVPPKPTEPAPTVLDKNVQEGLDQMIPVIETINKATIVENLENLPSIAKSLLRDKGNVKLEKARSTPAIYFDQALGVNNSTVLSDNSVEVLAEGYGQYEGAFEKVQAVVEEEQKKIAKLSLKNKKLEKFATVAGVDRMRNKQMVDNMLIGLYMDVRQAELNKLPNGEFSDSSPNPLVTLNMSIEKNPAPESKTLKKFKSKYVKNGEIKSEDILKDFNPQQKEVLESIDKENKKLEKIAIETRERNGETLTPIKGYFHRIVLTKDNESERVKVQRQGEMVSDRKLRSDALIDRTKGSKPINYNPFLSLLRGAQQSFIEYYIFPAADTVQDITENLVETFKDGNEGQVAAVKALDAAMKENIKTIYLNTFMGANNLSVTKVAGREVVKNMYRAMLGSATRFASELLGNMMMFVTQDPVIIKNAYTKFSPLTMTMKNRNKYKDVLFNLKSTEARKIGKRRTGTAASNRAIDVNDYLNLGQSTNQMMSGPVFEKIEQLLKFGPKQSYNAIGAIGDFLMGGSDKLVTTPVWASKFAFEFEKSVKKYNNEDISFELKDYDDIADGTSKYLTNPKYKKALIEARRKADRMVASFVTSGNPIKSILKNRRRSFGMDTTFRDYYRILNSFMANYTLNEYAQARFAIGALYKSGYYSKPVASKYLAGVLGRMSSYVILYGLLNNLMDPLFGAPEEEEDPLDQQIYRQLIGSSLTLIFRGGLGNIPSLPVNLIIEKLNKEYLEGLRDGKPYDAYDNSIVYSLISLNDLASKDPTDIIAPILTGPLAPLAKTSVRAASLVQRMLSSKKQSTVDKAYEELVDRIISQEVPGNFGMIPFYKDARRIALKKRFPKKAPSSSGKSKGGLQRRN
jgi:hypothetical protein|tara:strand:+ start:2420 stop:7852 length:5433 start_codon:yes stop_codon:yes gene_type:complete